MTGLTNMKNSIGGPGESGHPPVEKIVLDRGGWFSRLKNRSLLREYATKIYARKINFDELKDYLLKGGDPQVLKDYGTPVPLMEDPEVPVLNYFITGKTPADFPQPEDWETDQRPELIRSLRLLLDNGATANLQVNRPVAKREDASPVLFASWIGSVEALKVLLAYGGNLNQMQVLYGEDFGPALLIAHDDETADFILSQKPDLSVKTRDGYNMVQQLVFSPSYSTRIDFILQKIAWMKKKGLKFSWQEGDNLDPIKRALWMQKNFETGADGKKDPHLAEQWRQIGAALKDLKQ